MTAPVLLVTMPWDLPHYPSLPLGILRRLLTSAGIDARVSAQNLAWLDFLHEHAPADERLGVADYARVSESFIGLGDWIFAEPRAETDREYLELLARREDLAPLLPRILAARRQVPAFLAAAADELLAAAPGAVGFTSTFSQNVPSLALTRVLKQRAPGLPIVFGGANCDGPMGEALLRAFPEVDVVVRGEAERLVVPLFVDLLAGRPPRPLPGLCHRLGGPELVIIPQGGERVVMDDVPLPDYDDYFARLDRSPLAATIRPSIALPFESARGCWWGQKQHCTFCGLNGSTIDFRAKSSARTHDEIMALVGRYHRLDLMAVDNIMELEYFDSLLPRLRAAGLDLRFFYEVKANLRKDQLRAMAAAGIRHIQPGIESLSTPILQQMRKGITALLNIRLLKWCAQFGIDPAWNLLYGFPGESEAEYTRMAALVPALLHLKAPEMNPLQVQRFSPYFERPAAYGLEITGARRFYRLVYDLPAPILDQLAYIFEFRHMDGRQPAEYTASLRAAVERWRAESPRSFGALRYRRGPGFLKIRDRRSGGDIEYTLADGEAQIYLLCDAGATPAAIHARLPAPLQGELDVAEIRRFLRELVAINLAYEESDRFLALALADDPRTDELADGLAEAPAADRSRPRRVGLPLVA